jgi:hypothetical protein
VREGDVWFVESPLRARADSAVMDALLAELGAARREDVITRDQREARAVSLADYGLEAPRVRLVLADRLTRVEVAVGCAAPLGDRVYVRLDGRDDVIATSDRLAAAIPSGVEALRDRVVVAGDARRAVRLEFQQSIAGFVQLARSDGAWVLQQPVSARADQRLVLRMLEALYGLQVRRFVWDRPVDPLAEGLAGDLEDPVGRLAPYGLAADEAAAVITVWETGQDIGQQLLLGKPAAEDGSEVFARTRSMDSVFTVGTNILGVLAVSVNDLRSRVVFPFAADAVRTVCLQEGERRLVLEKRPDQGWTAVSPVQWKADDEFVGALVDKLVRLNVQAFVPPGGTNLADAGLSPPRLTVALGDRLPEARPAEPAGAGCLENGVCLLVGAPGVAKDALYAKLQQGNDLLEIPAAAIAALGERPAEPLQYRDRTVLSVPPANVTRISLIRNGEEQTVVRAGSEWRALAPAGARPDVAAVEDVLFFTSNLRAIRVEAYDPENLAAYGLERPGTTLTLGLTGQEGIQKSILFGYRSKTDALYANVQGQDLVFALGLGLVGQMTRDITEPAPPGEPAPGGAAAGGGP